MTEYVTSIEDSEPSFMAKYVPPVLSTGTILPLEISSEKFTEMYNLPISHLVDNHSFKEQSQKGNSSILYLSHSHAIRLFRQHFPAYEVTCEINPLTQGFVFSELDNSGFFIKPYVYTKKDGVEYRSSSIYFAVLSSNGSALTKPSSQAFNTAFYRARTKAIADVTGIGLKLWTGEDLSEDTDKAKIITQIVDLCANYRAFTGTEYPLPEEPLYLLTQNEVTAIGAQLTISLEQKKQEAKRAQQANKMLSTIKELVVKYKQISGNQYTLPENLDSLSPEELKPIGFELQSTIKNFEASKTETTVQPEVKTATTRQKKNPGTQIIEENEESPLLVSVE